MSTINSSYNFLDKAFLHDLTKNHLLFQVFYKHLTLIWILIPAFIAYYIYAGIQETLFQGIFFKLTYLFIPLALWKLKREFQAIILCISVKFTLGLCGVIFLTVGTFASYFQERNDTPFIFIAGLLLLPGPEYLKKFRNNQKYFTIARLILSIPLLYYGHTINIY